MAKQEYTVYYTKNTENNKIYVGCFKTEDNYLSQRKAAHKYNLRNNIHPNSDLQDDYNKYGEDAFKFCIKLDTVYDTKENAMKEEQRWMDRLGTKGERGYNRIYNGYQHSEKVKEKIGETNSGANHGRATAVIHIPSGRIFDTQVEAAEHLGISNKTVSKHCTGRAVNPKFEYA